MWIGSYHHTAILFPRLSNVWEVLWMDERTCQPVFGSLSATVSLPQKHGQNFLLDCPVSPAIQTKESCPSFHLTHSLGYTLEKVNAIKIPTALPRHLKPFRNQFIIKNLTCQNLIVATSKPLFKVEVIFRSNRKPRCQAPKAVLSFSEFPWSQLKPSTKVKWRSKTDRYRFLRTCLNYTYCTCCNIIFKPEAFNPTLGSVNRMLSLAEVYHKGDMHSHSWPSISFSKLCLFTCKTISRYWPGPSK